LLVYRTAPEVGLNIGEWSADARGFDPAESQSLVPR
jgi:hypothetical protein